MNAEQASVYQRGAQDGLIVGALMLAMFVCQAASLRVPWLGLMANALMLAVPVAAFVLMRRGYRQHPAQRQFATVWMHGIMMFICGSLIMAAGAYVYCRLLNPDFIPDLVRSAGQALMEMPDPSMARLGSQFEQMIEQKLLPTPIQMAFSMLWFGSFSGSMLSMLFAAIIRFFNNKTKQ